MSNENQPIEDLENVYRGLLTRFGVAGGGNNAPPPTSKKQVSDDNGPMEARIAAIENRLDSMDERMTRVEVKLDHIGEEVSNFKWWMAGALLTILVTVAGTAVGIQQMTVTTFQAASQERPAQAPAPQPIVIQLPAQEAPAAQPSAPSK